jgi:hypothetical protein
MIEFCLPQSFLLSYHKVSGIDVNKLGINDSLNEQLPTYQEERGSYKPSGTFRIYAGYSPNDNQYCYDAAAIENYYDDLELKGEDNPYFLGKLHFRGFPYFEWQYEGVSLSSNEVWQIVDLIQNTKRTSLH